jgi:hypothetical protein
MRNLPVNLDSRRCECGALTENGSPVCRKCRSRVRWLRRKCRKQNQTRND